MTTTTNTKATAASKTGATSWDKRLAEPKGFVEYNPDESFVIHVQWVVANRTCAREMIQALHTCATATWRDAPPVLCYWLRISHDQRLAVELKHRVATAGDHPQLAKKFKMAEMKMMPLSAIAAACDREGISSVPFRQGEDEGEEEDGACWTKDTHMTPERAKLLGFDPVVLDCTEIYLDNRAFSNHACSKDYLSAYSTLMQPFRSLEVHTVVAGTPTIGIWNRVLEPMLKARRAAEPERLVLQQAHHVWSGFAASSSCHCYLLLDVNVTTIQVAEDVIASVPNSPYHCLFQLPESSSSSSSSTTAVGYRLIMPVAVAADADKVRQVLGEDESTVSGRIMLFAKEPTSESVKNQFDMLQEMFRFHRGIEIVLVATTSSSSSISSTPGDHVNDEHKNDETLCLFAGYGLTEKLAELLPDTTVECKDYDKE